MVQTRWIRRAAIGGLLVLPILVTGCGLFSKKTNGEIDPPRTNETSNVDGANTGQAQQPGQGDATQMTVYLKDRNGYLAPVALQTTFGKNEQPGQKALEMMVDGGSYASQLPEDFKAVLPQGTQVKSFKVENKLAIVDFSEAFNSYTNTEERSILEAITWTLTAMPGIEGVELLSEGEKLQEMPVDGFPLDEPLTRAVGINLEAADGVNYANSTPVTLYFSSQTSHDEQYYVPVTRLIARPEKLADAAMEQLISGPLNKKELTSVITNDVKVNSIVQKDDTVTVDLQDPAYEEGQAAPEEMLQAVVLSLTENTKASKVQILLNGESNVIDDKNNSYTEPVTRPHHVNAIKS
ncbi:GerMN domain-containing protein [Paenibacillus gorillae]|uniref:GerMN domain-containing protein n=1 Tax=Paenibacillus gorillae TaxID=1243662 RepID=UPI0004B929FA|nr:GerMN domain-containing protein [Paenibacillus gorillae]